MRPLALIAIVLVAALAGCNLPFMNGGAVGSAAKGLVDPRKYAKLVIEIDYPQGYGPDADAINTFKQTLQQVSGRSADDITIDEQAQIPVEGGKKYTLGEIVDLENAHRDHKTSGDTAAVYMVYLAGGYADDNGNSRVLGLAYRGTSIAMMKGNLNDASRSQVVGGVTVPTVDESCIERAVLIHEFGHALGLVNLGTPMVKPHEDSAHPGHSSNKGSVMYYAVENTVDLFSLFTGGCSSIPYQYDGDDQSDLSALRAS